MDRRASAVSAARKAAEGTVIVAAFFDTVLLPRLIAYEPEGHVQHYLVSLAHRVMAQVQGLRCLGHIAHFQLVVAGCRSLLELVADASLVAKREPEDAVHRIETWEMSSKLKYAEATLAYLKRRGEKPGQAEAPLVDFCSRWKATIEAKRKSFWPAKSGKGRHPMRWTDQDLGTDLRRVDRLEGTDLERFYETEYRRMNWQIHGSGLAGIRGLDFPLLGVVFSVAHKMSGQLALQVARVLVRETSLLDDRGLAALDLAEEQWRLITLQGLINLENVQRSSGAEQ